MALISRILCPVDLSDCSAHALEHARALSDWYDASLTVLHVALSEYECQSVRERVVSFATTAHDGAELVVNVGIPARGILDAAAQRHADLIVMGTHGSGGFEHLVLGSVAEKVLRKAVCPVVTVPPRVHGAARLPFRRILCALDFSPSSCAAAEYAASIASECAAAVHLVHVVEWPWHEPPAPADLPRESRLALDEFRRYMTASATARMTSIAAERFGDAVTVTPHVEHGKSYVEILRAAERVDADLVVLGVHGRRPIDVMLLGSTANQVVRRAACPVLTVRRAAAPAA